jgi:DNA-binding transcriptional LysR family regulator
MQPGLNLNNLKYFYDAVETESVSEAARRNYITQSAVSQGIIKLEHALGISLITHQRNFFRLTPEGQIVFSLTQQIFSTLKCMCDVAQEYQDEVSGQINVACTQSIAMNLIAANLLKIKTLFTQISIKLKISKMDSIFLMLRRGLMDVGIAVESDSCDQFQKQVISKGYFNLYSKSGDIGDGIYVDHCDGLFVNRLSVHYREQFRKNLVILQELDSWQVLAKCASQGIGCCFLPDFILKDDPTLKICEGIEPIPYSIVAIYPKGAHLNRAAKVFLDHLSDKLFS